MPEVRIKSVANINLRGRMNMVLVFSEAQRRRMTRHESINKYKRANERSNCATLRFAFLISDFL